MNLCQFSLIHSILLVLATIIQFNTMSDTEESMSTEEIAKVVSALNKLKVKPKADSAEDFLSWMSYVVLEKKVKKEVVDTDNASASSQPEKSVPPSQLPKILFFSGDSKSDATYEVWI